MNIIFNKTDTDEAVKEWLDDDEKYKIWLEHRDEYLEYRRLIKEECEADKGLVEDVVMELQEMLDGIRELTEKPGWEILCYEKELRDFRCQFLDGTYIPNPQCVQHYPPMGDVEMARLTGLTRERIVQETKRCERKIGNKLRKLQKEANQYIQTEKDAWEDI